MAMTGLLHRCRRPAAALLAAAFLGGCELPAWMGESEAPPLPGDRISVLSLQASLEPDPGISDLAVRLPPPWRNVAWPQAGGFPSHAMHHLEVGERLAKAWSRDIGRGDDDEHRLLAQPVIADGRVFTMDSVANVRAFAAADGQPLWERDLTADGEDRGAIGGGVAYADGTVYASTGYGFIYALAASSGEELWRQNVNLPIRGAPTVSGGRVFAITYDNQLQVLSSDDGRVLWTHSGLPEETGLIGSPSPAVADNVVVVPYTSGELFALRVENGRVLWSDQLIRSVRLTPLSALSEIRGGPVIDRDMVTAISHSGRLVAVDLRTGQRRWDRDIEGIETPWVAGDFIYLVTLQAELVCLSRSGGRIRWVTPLQRYEDPDDRDGPIHWSGPVLVSDRLILTGSHGQAVAVSPYTGRLLGQIELSDDTSLPPVVADGTVYVLTKDADLVAYR